MAPARCLLLLVVSVVLVQAVPSLLPGDPRLSDPDHQHHHHDHGDHEQHEHHHDSEAQQAESTPSDPPPQPSEGSAQPRGKFWWLQADNPFERPSQTTEATVVGAASVVSDARAVLAVGNVDYGAGIQVAQPSPGHVGHFNPFLPNYKPTEAPAQAAGSAPTSSSSFQQQTQQQQQQQGFGGQVQQARPIIPISPEDLNRNPGTGNSGPLGPAARTCGASLICIPEPQCDPYTGFVVGGLDRPAPDPAQPTVALQRCTQLRSGVTGSGVCCQEPHLSDPWRNQQGNSRPTGQATRGNKRRGNRPGRRRNKNKNKKEDFGQNPFLGGDSGGSRGQGPSPGQQIYCSVGQECVERNLCGDDGYIITDGSGLIDIRIPSSQYCLTPFGKRGTCCLTPTTPAPPQPTSQSTGQPGGSSQVEVVCDVSQQCVQPGLCDDEGYIITDGSGLIDARNKFQRFYCRLTGGGKGQCCSPRPTAPTRQEIICDQNAEECVPNNQCGDDGFIITDGSGLLDIRIKGPFYCKIGGGGGGAEGTCCKRRAQPGPQLISCGQAEQCVPPNLCDDQGYIITDGSGLIDIRFNNNKYCQVDGGAVGEKGTCCRPRPTAPTVPSGLVTCSAGETCVTPIFCDRDGYIITDGAGLRATGTDTNAQYCEAEGGGRGTCCRPRPSAPGGLVTCSAGQSCVTPDLCDPDGYLITDGAGLLNTRFNNRQYCRLDAGGKGTCCSASPAGPGGSQEVTCDADQDCVTPDLCGEDGVIITDGGGLIDTRFDSKRRQYCRLVGGGRGKCCRRPGTGPGGGPEPFCGQSLDIRILGVSPDKTEANFGELPWQTVVFYTNYTFVCGGSLVSKRHVVTAAHCVQYLSPGDIQVRLGDYQVNAETEPQPYQDVKIAAIKIHPGFRRGPLYNDVAVLELAEDAKLDSHIQPICLPKPGQVFTGRCVASGWGKDAFDGDFSAILKKVRLPMVDNQSCENLLKKTRLGSFFRLHNSFVCAGGEQGIDACRGDGGGPLACPVDGQYVLAGITAWGVGCGQKDVPGVYASTAATLDFISQNVA